MSGIARTNWTSLREWVGQMLIASRTSLPEQHLALSWKKERSQRSVGCSCSPYALRQAIPALTPSITKTTCNMYGVVHMYCQFGSPLSFRSPIQGCEQDSLLHCKEMLLKYKCHSKLLPTGIGLHLALFELVYDVYISRRRQSPRLRGCAPSFLCVPIVPSSGEASKGMALADRPLFFLFSTYDNSFSMFPWESRKCVATVTSEASNLL